MANRFVRQAEINGDIDTWGPLEHEQNRRSNVIQSSFVYQSLGTLYVSKGRIGLYDGNEHGTCIIDTNTAISIAAISNYNWSKVEVATDGFNIQFSVSDITGATDPDTIPAVFENSYDGDRGGYYISPDKRIIGLIFKTNSNANNPILYIVNCNSANKGYIGGLSDNELSLKFYKMSGIDGSYYNYLKIMRSLLTARFESKTVPENNSYNSVVWSPELEIFCAIARTGVNRVMTSPDGVNWSAFAASVNNDWYDLSWSPGLSLFCAIARSGAGDRVMTSPDGENWTTRVSAEDNTWTGITWAPEINLFVAVAQDGTNRVMTSPDGINWTARAVTANSWQDVAWSPELGLYCAVALNASVDNIMTSPDGENWTDRTGSEATQWKAITWSKKLGLFIVVGAAGGVMTSPDGINWTSQESGNTNNWASITWSPELELLCSGHSDADLTYGIMTSPDGINWILRNHVNTYRNIYSIEWSPKLNMFACLTGTGAAVYGVISSLVVN